MGPCVPDTGCRAAVHPLPVSELAVPAPGGGMVLPYGAVHPGHGEEGSQVGRVGGAHDEGEEPPASHHDAHGHGVRGGSAPCGRQAEAIGPGLPLSLPSPRPCSGHRASPAMGWGAEKWLPAYHGGRWQFWERGLGRQSWEWMEDHKIWKNQNWPFTDEVLVKTPRIKS